MRPRFLRNCVEKAKYSHSGDFLLGKYKKTVAKILQNVYYIVNRQICG